MHHYIRPRAGVIISHREGALYRCLQMMQLEVRRTRYS